MKLDTLFAALGCSAKVLNTASSLAIIVGAIYLVDCRTHASGADAVDRCYLSALPMMGIGVAGRGGFSVGYNTFNPSLRPEEPAQSPERDEKGRFLKRG
jgi:hypothetical protein